MNPKEKAIELVNKIAKEQHFDNSAILIGISTINIALLCVDEIMNCCAFLNHEYKKEYLEQMDYSDNHFTSYWQQVKQEIINLK